MDILLFATTAALSLWMAKADASSTAANTCQNTVETSSSLPKNAAFVFVKPHANTRLVQELVRNTLQSKGVSILKEVSIGGEEIDAKKLIDQHYYAIGTDVRCVVLCCIALCCVIALYPNEQKMCQSSYYIYNSHIYIYMYYDMLFAFESNQ